MDKTAQTKRQTGRGILNELREKVNMPGAYLDSFFKPELDRVMTALKQLDDRIRSEITGTKIGTAEAPETPVAAKKLLKDARTAFNRNEYMTGIADLGAFHKKLADIVNDINKFYVDVNKIHHKFLFEGMDEEKLKRLRSHMERKAELELAAMMIKQAGILDFFHNIGTRRGRALSAWVKKYPKETKALREGGDRLITAGEQMLESTLAHLKEMATARAIRRPDDYMDAANKIKAEFAKFDSGDKGFTAYYHNAVVPFLKIKDEMDKQAPAQPAAPTGGPQPGQVELGEEPPPTEPSPSGPPSGGGTPAPAPAPPPPMGGPPGASPPFAPPAQSGVVPEAPDTLRDLPVAEAPKVRVEEPKFRVAAHAKFMQSLEAMSNEDPRVLAGYISRYAKSIQNSDPKVAIELFSIVKRLRG